MKKILILILITALMILSCKEVPTDVNTSQDNNNENSGNNNNNGNNGGSTVTPEELEKYGIDIASALLKQLKKP